MSENTAAAMCTEAEYTAAREAGLLFVTSGTTAQERAIHRFAEAIRAQLVNEMRQAQAAASEACAQLFDLAERGDSTNAVRDAKQAVFHLQASQVRIRDVLAQLAEQA